MYEPNTLIVKFKVFHTTSSIVHTDHLLKSMKQRFHILEQDEFLDKLFSCSDYAFQEKLRSKSLCSDFARVITCFRACCYFIFVEIPDVPEKNATDLKNSNGNCFILIIIYRRQWHKSLKSYGKKHKRSSTIQ